MGLSDKAKINFHSMSEQRVYPEKDVKKFIKELKDYYCHCGVRNKHCCTFCQKLLILAGEKLV